MPHTRSSEAWFPGRLRPAVHGSQGPWPGSGPLSRKNANGRDLRQDPIATPEGVAMTAALLDELLARLTVPGRPADLTDDLTWVRAASGRAPHSDPRLPLLG